MSAAPPRFSPWLGLGAPLAAAVLGAGAYRGLTRLSADPDEDFRFRLGAVAVVMLLPPAFALWRAFRARRAGTLTGAGTVGAVAALLSVGLAWVPVSAALRRARQAENLALSGAAAPDFVARDLDGRIHRLSDRRGSVVLVNIWATWCPPCRAEMPELDRLARQRREEGFFVFGVSTEDEETQRAFRDNEVSVAYPLLLPDADAGEGGGMPPIFTETARYPANFLIDREGLLHPAPSTDRPFAELEAAVESLLDGS